jgi:hypothetical protein
MGFGAASISALGAQTVPVAQVHTLDGSSSETLRNRNKAVRTRVFHWPGVIKEL